MQKKKGNIKGIPVGMLNYLMAALTLLVSVMLLVTTFATDTAYKEMRETTENYYNWERSASELQKGSDYLTDQVRCFAATGAQEYMGNYFLEAEGTRRRDKALEGMGEAMKDSQAYRELEAAMAASVHLMKQEYYSMRLMVEALGLDLDRCPHAVSQVMLSDGDAALSPAEQKALALQMVFDQSYREQKADISGDMDKCLTELANQLERKMTNSSTRLNHLLLVQRVFIVLLIVIVLAIILATSTLVISPLLRAVLHIREEEPIPIRGGYEFRFLAQTYNLMYEINRDSKKKLAFAASHDKLTGLYNRSGYDYAMEHTDLSNCALLLVDVDHFKDINDTYGHETGDRMLLWVGQVLRSSFRSQDHVCRIGGDEFTILMHNVNPQHAQLIQKKAASMNERLSNPDDDRPPVSISVGVAFGQDDSTPESLYLRADEALYQVKEHGRKGCAIAQ